MYASGDYSQTSTKFREFPRTPQLPPNQQQIILISNTSLEIQMSLDFDMQRGTPTYHLAQSRKNYNNNK